MSEGMLVRHCSPTLAGMKTGSLFSCECPSVEELKGDLRRLNRTLGKKGIRVIPLRRSRKRALIYVYRPSQLRRDLASPQIRSLLDEYGYAGRSPEQCLVLLIRKLRQQEEFPHEIGLFLGYPPEDVRGFIENKAACCKCVGCWKVYGDPQAAQQTFCKFRKCTQVYCRQWEQGRPLERLTVTSA